MRSPLRIISDHCNQSTSIEKMHPPHQQTIYHPNAMPSGQQQRHASSTVGINSGHPQQRMESSDNCMDRGREDLRNEGRRSRRASYDASPGVKKQRFEIIKKLGSGTYGKVSLALDHRTGEEVAVKVIKKSAIENTADLIRIRREIRIMSALKHPQIIEIKEVFENDDKIILVMEYASGGELYDYVSSSGPLGELEVRRLFRQIVSAVYYCHKHGVAHRDLKLENILLDKDMNAKIADFGLSNYFKPTSLLHTFCGSPLYASPEIINGTPYKGPEVDCWSLGVLLYTLAYSSMPFDGRDFNRMIRQIKRGAYYEPDPPSSASMLIRSMLRVNPDRRADITSIASHWWLNFDENLQCICDLEENQVLDSTPLYIRQETLMIQSLGEETEMFAEYTHLSDATKKKIEEFRRRKQEANWYLTDSQSPLRKQSKKRSSSVISDRKRQSSQHVNQKQGSQAAIQSPGVTKKQSSHAVIKQQPSPTTPTAAPVFAKPAPEYQTTPVPSAAVIAALVTVIPQQPKSVPQEPPRPPTPIQSPMTFAAELELVAKEIKLAGGDLRSMPAPLATSVHMDHQPTPVPSFTRIVEEICQPVSTPIPREPSPAPSVSSMVTSITETSLREEISISSPMRHTVELEEEEEEEEEEPPKRRVSIEIIPAKPLPPPPMYESETVIDNHQSNAIDTALVEEANQLINQLMEEAMNGPVSLDLVDNIRASQAYEKEQFVKDILESVLTSQMPKPVTTPSMPNVRSRSRHSSMTRMPSSSTPIPTDIGYPDSDRISTGAMTPPPQDVYASFNDEAFITPTAQLTITLPHHNVIHQTVPEEAELELNASGEDMMRPPGPIPESEDEEEEEEEDVYSTDFEDMDEPSSEEEELQSAHQSLEEETDILLPSDLIPISTVDSCASLVHDDLAPLQDILPTFPSLEDPLSLVQHLANEQTVSLEETSPLSPAPVPEKVIFRRGLAKRLSRGKYERSKFIFKREISIEASPPPTRRKIGGVQPQPKDAPKLFRKAEQYILQYPDPERVSPERAYEGRRRRYSDGDKKKEQQNQCAASNNQQTWQNANTGTVMQSTTPYVNGIASCEDRIEDGLVSISMQRRQERAMERRHIMDDYMPVDSCYIIGIPDNRATSPACTPAQQKKRTYVSQGEAKAVGAIEPVTLQVQPKTRKSSVEPLLDILEAGGGIPDEYDSGTAAYGMPRSPNLARPPSNPNINADLRRHSYRSAMEDSMNSSQDDRNSTGSRDNAPAPLLAPISPPIPNDQPRVKYASPALTNAVPAAEPSWMHREENHRHQTPTYHGYNTGEFSSDRTRLMSPIASGYERNEEEYYAVRNHVHGSYRSSSVFTNPHSREMSPAQGRSLFSPLRTNQYDTDPYRRQKAKSWYTSGIDTMEDSNRYGRSVGPPRFESATSRRSNPTPVNAVGSYLRSFFDSAYNRAPKTQDLKLDRDKSTMPSTAAQIGIFSRDSSLKRRSRSLDKSQHTANKPATDIPMRKYPPILKANGAYMADDRLDISSHSAYNYETSTNMQMESLSGAGRFGSLMLNSGSAKADIPPSEKVPMKGILKKQSPVSPIGYSSRYTEDKKTTNFDMGNNRLNFIDRFRRHMSTEKPSTASRSSEPMDDRKRRTPRAGSTSPDSSKQSSKKRSLLQIGRRRTQEAGRIGNGTDSGFGSGSLSSDEYGSHVSSTNTTPIEKLKGFFNTGHHPSTKAVRESTPINSHYSSSTSSGRDTSASGFVSAYRKAYQSSTPRASSYKKPSARY